jgi:tetratricopeptide (TPR) repeat protein
VILAYTSTTAACWLRPEEQGITAHHQGRFHQAQRCVEEGLALLTELGERYERPNTELTLANILLHRGDWDGCRVHVEQALALAPASQDNGYVFWAHYLLSAVALADYAYDLSLQHGLEAISLAHRTGFGLRALSQVQPAGRGEWRPGSGETASVKPLDVQQGVSGSALATSSLHLWPRRG